MVKKGSTASPFLSKLPLEDVTRAACRTRHVQAAKALMTIEARYIEATVIGDHRRPVCAVFTCPTAILRRVRNMIINLRWNGNA